MLASPIARFGGQRQLFAHFRYTPIAIVPATPPGMTMAKEAGALVERALNGKVARVFGRDRSDPG